MAQHGEWQTAPGGPLMSDYWGRVGVGGEGLAGVGEGEAM